MSPQEHNMAVSGQIVKLIPKKLIEKLKNKYKIQTRSFSATSHVVAMHWVWTISVIVCDSMPATFFSNQRLRSPKQEWTCPCQRKQKSRNGGRIVLVRSCRNQADFTTCGFPRNQWKCYQMANLDSVTVLFAPSACRMDCRIKQSFRRLYTLVKEMLWNRRNSWCLTLTDNSA